MAIFYSIAILILAINLLLGLPKVVDLTQSKILAANIPSSNNIDRQVAGVSTIKSPPKSKGLTAPTISASSALVKDMTSNLVLYSKDPNKKVPIASTTKIMTALVAVLYFKPNDNLEVKGSGNFGSVMGLKVGERLSFRSLLYGMLLNSGNDAAFTIAENYPGGVREFVSQMNQKADDMELLNTHFDNPAGFDSSYHYSSASDLARISEIAQSNSQIARVVATKETTVASLDKGTVHTLKNLNQLLSIPGVLGIKTGTTPAARENLVGLIERDGQKLLTVVLGSDDRFGETKALIDWTFSNFSWDN